ncbi:MAG: hypothetical protein IKX35_06000 [Bacteroidales bacterium]|nr:hypothetical protein [Bacteroidales bacterium]MBR5081975.1 hypothetical protein [Bacteroidales bacterium]
MKLKELISQTKWQDVAIAMVIEHPYQRKNLDGYRIIFETLMMIEPVESEYQIRIERTPDILEPEYTYPDVFGIKDGDENRWSMEFSSWAEWLGMVVCKETLEVFSANQIVANCLYEMTFFGFTEDTINQEKQKLEDSIKETKEHPENLKEFKLEDYRVEISMKGYLQCLDRWLRWGTLSRDYFGEDGSWFKERFLRKKAPDYYEELDRQTLKAALKEVAREILDVAKEL